MRILWIALLSFFILGCAPKVKIQKSQSYAVVIKMKGLAYSDMGFLNYAKGYTELQLFDLANPVLKLTIKDDVCINSHCFSYQDFNERFLSSSYPKQLLKNVLNAKAIFNKEGYIVTNSGFEQKIDRKNIHIKYFVSQDKIYFKDFSNHILIKLKRIVE